MNRSIRTRLQWWYGVVYAASIVVFGCLVYWRLDRDAHDRAAQKVVSATQYLDVSLRTAPGRWNNANGPPHDLGPLPRDFDLRPPRDNRGRPDTGGRLDEMPSADSPRGVALPEFRPRDGGPPKSGRPEKGRPPFDRPADNQPDMLLVSDELLDSTFSDRGGPSDSRPDARVEFVVWRPDGSVLASEGQQLVSMVQGQIPNIGRNGGLRVQFAAGYVQATKRGPGGMVITTLRSTQQDFDELRRFGLQMAGIGFLLLTTGLLGGWWISGRMVRPIERISSTAAQISVSNLNARIDTQELDQELVQLGSVLNEAFERLQTSFERLTQFTADASHELRTPLAVIQSQIELTLSQERTAESYQQTLQTCLNSTHRLQSMVDGLLLLARADAERLDVAQQTFDLRTIAEDVCIQLQSKAIEAGVQLDCVTPEDPVIVSGDPSFLARVPFNLVDNAIQQTPANGSITIEVLLEAAQAELDGPAALLKVTDTGCGIAVEHLAHLFDRFYRADVSRSRARGGSGLGLAICKSIVHAHAGSIWCESRLGSGAMFVVRLPLAEKGSHRHHHDRVL